MSREPGGAGPSSIVLAALIALAPRTARCQEAAAIPAERGPSAPAAAAPPAPLIVEGHVLIERSGTAERRIALGCAGDLVVRDGDRAYVPCPPRQVARVSLSGQTASAVVLDVWVDISDLRVVAGAPVVVDEAGVARPLARALRDPRVDALLAEVADRDAAGDDDRALALLEDAVATPRRPPLAWRTETSIALSERLRHLESPASLRGLFVPGIVTGVVGAVGIAVTSVVFAAIGNGSSGGGCSFSTLSCSPSSTPPVEPPPIGGFAAGWSLAGALLVSAVFMIIAGRDVFTPAAQSFDARRRALLGDLE